MKIITDIHPLWLIPLALLCGVLSYFYYKKTAWVNESPSWVKTTLIALRSISLFLVGALLLGLAIEAIGYRDEKPLLLAIYDNSSSMKNYKDSGVVKQQMETIHNQLNAQLTDKMDVQHFTIGEELKDYNTLNFKEKSSQLSLAFENVLARYYNRNVGAVVLVSDGNYNTGINPIYTAKKLPLCPIYTIGTGDTIDKKDQRIKQVITNEVAFLKNKFPIEVVVEASKCGATNSTVQLIHKGKVIANKVIRYKDNQSHIVKVNFEVEANEIGYQQYQCVVTPLPNEYTTKNNSYPFYIEVLDNRNKVLIVSSAPHPDLTAIKSSLEKAQNLKVSVKRFDDLKSSDKDVDLVIWHEPGIDFTTLKLKEIQAMNTPVFYFIGPNTSSSVVNQLNLNISLANSNQTDDVQASINKIAPVIEFSETVEKSLGYFPPVQTKFGSIELAPNYDVVFQQRVGGILNNDPLLFFKSSGSKKIGVFYGEGIWRWKLYEFAKTSSNEAFDEIIQKSCNFMLNKENTSALRISLPSRFTSDENIQLKAEFYNENMELTNKPLIQFNLVNAQQKKSVFQFAATGDYYTLSIGKLKPGKYTWTATTNYRSKKYQKQGVFFVEEQQIEAFDVKANHSILRQLAQQSKGSFYNLAQADKIYKVLQLKPEITTVSYEETKTHNLLDYGWILTCILLILGIEWFIRRWFGGY